MNGEFPKKKLSHTAVSDLYDLVDLVSSIRNEDPASKPMQADTPDDLLNLISTEMQFLRGGGIKASSVIPALMFTLGYDEKTPLGKTTESLARLLEKVKDQPSYHNSHHAVEVAIAAYILGRRQKLPVERIAELVVAATVHDLEHNGANNTYPFEQEEVAFKKAEPILVKAGVSVVSRSRIKQMILGTDFVNGVLGVKKDFLETESLPANDSKRLLAVQKLLLVEADILFSCFDLHYNSLLSKLLSSEWKRSTENLSFKERIGFVSSVKFLSDAAINMMLEERRLSLLNTLIAQSQKAAA